VIGGVLPVLQDADLAAGEQDRKPVEVAGRPHLAAPHLGPVEFDQGHRGVVAGAAEASAGHQVVAGVDDLDAAMTGLGTTQQQLLKRSLGYHPGA
jgi:hypothetical protein